ncbi:MAG: GntG family PLP-dependent aldolase [Bacteroidota bacterium]
MIDLRSDTVTKPTPELLQAMMEAEVGDDVFGEDPTVNRVQQKVADYFGMEAGLFVPSGVMSNQLGIKVLTQPGDELLMDEKGHIFNYETGGASFLSGVQIHPLKGKRGKLSPEDVQHTVRGSFDWEPRTRVLAIENSTNKGGGVCYQKEELIELKSFASKHDLSFHIDGARIWNAMVATHIEPAFFGGLADTISVCFSKGLGAPVGSMLLASNERIGLARRYRKMWGGGMRQVGLLAAAAEYALDHNLSKLELDHQRARQLAQIISQHPGLSIDVESVETNILMFNTLKEDASSLVNRLSAQGIGVVPFGPNTVRATFHYQVTNDDFERLIHVFETL